MRYYLQGGCIIKATTKQGSVALMGNTSDHDRPSIYVRSNYPEFIHNVMNEIMVGLSKR